MKHSEHYAHASEEKNLDRCLESVRGVFDEIVVVDTGSVDRTPEIARAYGARVFDFVWVDDFAAARNGALARARGDYAFWLDADHVIEPPEREKLVALLRGLSSAEMPARTEPRPTDLHDFSYVTPWGDRRFFRCASRIFWTDV